MKCDREETMALTKVTDEIWVYTKWCWWWFFNTIFCIHKISSQCYKMKLYKCSWIYHSHLRFRLTLRDIHRWFAKLERAATSVARSTTLPGCVWHYNAYPLETTAGGCGLREADSQLTCSFTKEGLEMLMDNTLELLGITDSNIKVTRFSAESVTVRLQASSE